MIRKLSFPTLFFTLFGSLLFLGACGSGHDHYSAIGVVLSEDGQMIAAQEQENITYAEGDAISVPVGSSTGTITVEFLGDDGTPFTPERSGYSLRHTIGNADVLDITHPAVDEWSFRLTGNRVGTTTIEFDLWHGNHSDFSSRAFQVRVEESEND